MTKTQIARIPTRRLNTTDDAQPGSIQSSGPSYLGQLGVWDRLNADQALKLSDTSVGTLYAGTYQYVKFLTAGAIGKAAFWSDPDNFVVTTTAPATGVGFAGVCLNTVTAGNYGWILVEGKVACQTINSPTAHAIGDGVALDLSTGYFDDLGSGTALDGTNLKLEVGQWAEDPASGNTLYKAYVSAVKNAVL